MTTAHRLRIVYNVQRLGLVHCIQCATVLLIVYNAQSVLRIVDTEQEMVHIVYNAQIVQIEYDICKALTRRLAAYMYITNI